MGEIYTDCVPALSLRSIGEPIVMTANEHSPQLIFKTCFTLEGRADYNQKTTRNQIFYLYFMRKKREVIKYSEAVQSRFEGINGWSDTLELILRRIGSLLSEGEITFLRLYAAIHLARDLWKFLNY